MSPRQVSLGARLARLGFQRPARAEQLLADPALAGLIDPLDAVFSDGLLPAVGETPDPDLALLALVRLMESLRRVSARDPDDPSVAAADVAHLLQAIRVGGPARDRLLAVLGSSTALGASPESDAAASGTSGGKCPFSAMIPATEGALDARSVQTAEMPVRWTAAAEARLANIPEFVRPMAKTGIEKFALDKGALEVDEKILDEARDFFGM